MALRSPGGGGSVDLGAPGPIGDDTPDEGNFTTLDVTTGPIILPQGPSTTGTTGSGIFFDSQAGNKTAIIGFNNQLYVRADNQVVFLAGPDGNGWSSKLFQLHGTAGVIGWSHGNAPNGNPNTGITSNANGVVEINQGRRVADGGSYGSLKVASLTTSGLIHHAQYTDATEPSYVAGASYYNTDSDKLQIGGASAWEEVTSA